MSTRKTSIVPDAVTQQNCAVDRYIKTRWKPMNLKTWKALKNFTISMSIIGFAVFAIGKGADALQVFSLTIIVLGLVNGMEISELYAAWAEVEAGDSGDSTSDSDTDSGS